jgi:hypothetical protein
MVALGEQCSAATVVAAARRTEKKKPQFIMNGCLVRTRRSSNESVDESRSGSLSGRVFYGINTNADTLSDFQLPVYKFGIPPSRVEVHSRYRTVSQTRNGNRS